MTVIRNNSISGINSITAQSSALNFYDSTGNTLSIGASVSGNITGNLAGNVTGPGDSTFNGSVGIGTDNPTYALQVHNSSIPRIHLTNDTTGTTTSDGFQIYANGNDAIILNKENSVLQFGTNNTTRATITSDGNVQIANGNLVFSTSGTGIDFSATSDGGGTTTSELLDDYEEGTWDPGYSFGGTAHTSIVSAGTYIKTGGMVFVTGYLYTNDSSTYSGTATITGLPFSIPSGMRYRGAFTVGQIRRFNEDMPNIKLYAGDNGSTISMFKQSTNSNGATELTNSQFNFQSEFNILSFSGSYPVA